jgi:hypothetical protein
MATMGQAETLIRRAIRTGDNIMLLSPPARGKTYLIDRVTKDALAAKEIDTVVQFDCATLSPNDTSMSMPDMQNLIIQVVRDGRLPNYYDTPNMKGVIIFGEWMLMGLEASKVNQKLVNHEDLGSTNGKGFKLPPGVVCVADGNRLQDKSGAMQQSRAIMSRFMVHELEFDLDYAVDAIKGGYHEVISTYLTKHPMEIDNYTDVFENEKRAANDITLIEGKRGAWANLRTWAKVSRLLRDEDETGIAVMPDEIVSCVGSGKANTFGTFRSVLSKLASIEDIINDPKKVPVPEKMDEKFYMSYLLAFVVKNETFTPISVYMNRFVPELQTAFFRLMNERLRKNPNDPGTAKIRTTDEYKNWITAKHISAVLTAASSS